LERIAQAMDLRCAPRFVDARFARCSRSWCRRREADRQPANIFIDVSQSPSSILSGWLIERLRRSLTKATMRRRSPAFGQLFQPGRRVRRVKASAAIDTNSVTITGILDQWPQHGRVASTMAAWSTCSARPCGERKVMIHPRASA